MTNEERDLLTSFVQRISGVGAAGQLPPLDPEADRLLADLFTRCPEARYRMTQTAFVQEAALHQAQVQIQQLQTALEQARAASQPPAEAARPSGFFGGMFGGSQPQPVAPVAPRPNPWGQAPAAAQPAYAPPPAYPQPAYQPPAQMMSPQMMQPGGTGFFGSAVRTAAGVAGGMVLGNALMNMFSGPHMGGGFGGIGGGMGGGMGGFPGAPVNETIINNYNEPPPDAATQDAGWDQPVSDPGTDSGWQDASDPDPGFGGGGFDDSTDV